MHTIFDRGSNLYSKVKSNLCFYRLNYWRTINSSLGITGNYFINFTTSRFSRLTDANVLELSSDQNDYIAQAFDWYVKKYGIDITQPMRVVLTLTPAPSDPLVSIYSIRIEGFKSDGSKFSVSSESDFKNVAFEALC